MSTAAAAAAKTDFGNGLAQREGDLSRDISKPLFLISFCLSGMVTKLSATQHTHT